MLIGNPRSARTRYPADLAAIMSIERADESRKWLAHWNGLAPAPTALHDLPALARTLDLARVSVKDESQRSPLGSFKALGAPIALVRLILRKWPAAALEPARLLAGSHAKLIEHFTVTSATDGNHGRALAAAAKSVGCRCVIVLHAKVSEERERAIADFGAQIVRIAGNYDDSVTEAARLAAESGWHVVSDTSYAGYEDIPRDVMQGYGTIAAEAIEQTGAQRDAPGAFTHVFVQGGVGGLAAGFGSYLWQFHGEHRPVFVVVEPEQADCLYQSAAVGRVARSGGSIDSVMAGLACGEASPLAWRFLEPLVDHFMTIADTHAVEAMRIAAAGGGGDVPLVVGESGAAGLAGLIRLRRDRMRSHRAGLTATSRVLLINTEGATAPSVYRDLVGESADSVFRRQGVWLRSPPHADSRERK